MKLGHNSVPMSMSSFSYELANVELPGFLENAFSDTGNSGHFGWHM